MDIGPKYIQFNNPQNEVAQYCSSTDYKAQAITDATIKTSVRFLHLPPSNIFINNENINHFNHFNHFNNFNHFNQLNPNNKTSQVEASKIHKINTDSTYRRSIYKYGYSLGRRNKIINANKYSEAYYNIFMEGYQKAQYNIPPEERVSNEKKYHEKRSKGLIDSTAEHNPIINKKRPRDEDKCVETKSKRPKIGTTKSLSDDKIIQKAIFDANKKQSYNTSGQVEIPNKKRYREGDECVNIGKRQKIGAITLFLGDKFIKKAFFDIGNRKS